MTRLAVQYTSEFDRVMALPRRRWERDGEAWAAKLTAILRTPEGQMALKPFQGATLAELIMCGGAFIQGPVGCGKTIPCLLASAALALLSEPPRFTVIVVPAHLRRKTIEEAKKLRKDWKIGALRVISYNEISNIKGWSLLMSCKPDLLIFDEAHRLKNPKAGCTKKVWRYVWEQRAEGRLIRVLALSGTMAKRSIKDFWHIMCMCRPDAVPLPDRQHYKQMVAWACAVDERVGDAERLDPGALVDFASPELLTDEEKKAIVDGGGSDLTRARVGLRSRMFSTPGILTTSEANVDCSLSVICHELPPSEPIEQAFQLLREKQEVLDGDSVSSPVDQWRVERQIQLGFYSTWEPKAPDLWRLRRKEWHALCRELLSGSNSEADTPMEVALSITRQGEKHPGWQVYQNWVAVRDSFEPVSVPKWIDDTPLEWVVDWGEARKREKTGGLIWCEHVPFAKKLAKETGWSYFGAQGVCRVTGRFIEEARPGEVAIASVDSNATGRNLQGIWHRALITACKPTGILVEQLLGRLHRQGQPEDEVITDWLIGCSAAYNGVLNARGDSTMHDELLGAPAKLTYCDLVIPQIRSIHTHAFAGLRL